MLDIKTDAVNTRKLALSMVAFERYYQDLLWGVQNHQLSVWVSILGEEYGEFCEAVNETIFNNGFEAQKKGGYDNILLEITQIAAVSVAVIEFILRNHNHDLNNA